MTHRPRTALAVGRHAPRRHPVLPAWLLVAVSAGAALAQPTQTPALKNGGFDQPRARGNLPTRWMTVFPMNIPSRPSFARDPAVKHSGAASGRITCAVKFGYVSWTQSVAVPAGTKTAIFKGWLRTGLADGSASLLMVAMDARGRQLGMTPLGSAALSGKADWRQRTARLAVPQATARLIVRAGVHGKGTAWFDDLSLSFSAKLVPPVAGPVVYAEIEGAYTAWPTGDAAEPSVTISIPGPFEAQMPVEYAVRSIPHGKIRNWLILAKAENRFLRVNLHPMKRGERVQLRWQAKVLLRERPGTFGLGAEPIRLAQNVPPPLAEFLRPARGVEVGSAEVKAAAAALQITDPKDFGAIIRAVSALMAKRVKFAGGENQGAVHSLRAGKAVCTGCANVACAVLRAKGIPTRILANVMTGSSAQEHYITESYVARYGWVRYESTQKAFPVPDTSHIVLRVVRPTDARSPLNVPLYLECSKGMAANYQLAFGSRNCWHRSKTIATRTFRSADVARAYETLSKFWAEHQGKPSKDKTLSGAQRISDFLRQLVPPPGDS